MEKRIGMVLLMFLLVLPVGVFAGDTATQTVRYKIEPIAVIALAGTGENNQTLLIVNDSGVATGSRELKWTTNLEQVKVTVHSNLTFDEQNYLLKVRAVGTNTEGVLNGWVTVTEEPSELIKGISREIGGCSLEYQASPKTSAPEEDEHIIVFTITE